MYINTFKTKTLPLILMSVFITACGGGGGSDSASHNTNADDLENQKLCSSVQYLENNACKDKLTHQILTPDLENLLINNRYFFKPVTSAQQSLKVESLTPSICTVDGDDIIAVTQGTCSLALSYDGKGKYLPVASNINLTVSMPLASEINQPDVDLCKSGSLSEDEKQKTLEMVNDIRSLHGLSPVKYDYSHDDEMMKTALVIAANQRLSHYPSKDMLCYSDLAYEGSGTSNLGYLHNSGHLDLDASNIVIASITEEHSATIGHRRWLLSPFLTQISVGAVLNTTSYRFTQGAALKVVYPEDLIKPSINAPMLIAYPYQNYPSKYFVKGVPLSISIFANKNSSWDNDNIDFAQAKVTVTERATGTLQNITNIKFDNVGTGLPNSLQFNFDTLDYNRIYDVKIKDVKVNGQMKDYDYWFKIVE